MDSFVKTKVKLTEALKLLACTKCLKHPEESVWMLSSCKHKYCKGCYGILEVNPGKAKKCMACNQFSPDQREPLPDLFSTKLLAELKVFKKYLGRCSSETEDEEIVANEADDRNDDFAPDVYAKDSSTTDEIEENTVEKNDRINSDSKEEETEEAFRSELPTRFTLQAPAPTFGENDTTTTTNKELDGIEPEKDLDIGDDSDKVETKKIPPRRKFFTRKRAGEKSKPQEPQVNVSLPIPKEPKKALPVVPISKTRKGTTTTTTTKNKIQGSVTPKVPLRTYARNSVASVSKSTPATNAGSTPTTPVANSPASVKRKNAKGETALHVAARNGQVDRVKKLLEMAADVNAQDFAGWTPLHEAVNGKSKNSLQVAEILLISGCLVNVTGGTRETALHEAAHIGNVDMVKLLLSYSASKEIPNEAGQLACDVAKTPAIADLITKFNGPYKRKLTFADVLSITRLRETTSLIYFSYEVDDDLLNKLVDSFALKLKITKNFSRDVTHIIFDSKPKSLVPLTLDYPRGLLIGAWLLSSEWLTESVSRKNLLDPDGFEIGGYVKNSSNPSDLPDASTTEFPGGSSGAQKRARLNRERKNPGLFHGLSFYIYKDSAYHQESLKLDKKELAQIIRLGEGEVLIREPNPDVVDPLDNPVRFHVTKPTHKLIFTSHVILFGDGNVPPPAKQHNLEHVKTLRVDWFIQCLLNFGICDTTPFLA